MLTKNKNIIIIGICLAVGWLLGLICKDLGWFVYDNTFSIFELLYFLLTTGTAVYIAHRIEKGLQDTRNQKDILIKQIEEVTRDIDCIWNSIQRVGKHYEIDLFDITSQLKNLAMQIQRTHKAIEHFYPTAYTNNLESLSIITLRQLTTYTQRGTSTIISCEAGRMHYSDERYADIRMEISKLKDICFEDILELNAI